MMSRLMDFFGKGPSITDFTAIRLFLVKGFFIKDIMVSGE